MQEAGVKSLQDIPTYPELLALSKPDFDLSDKNIEKDEGTISGENLAEQIAASSSPKINLSTLAELVPISVGGFDISFSRKNSRCNITHKETSQTASIKLKERRCVSDDVDFSQVNSGQWKCPAWALSVEFYTGTTQAIGLSLQQLGVLIQLEL